MIMHGFVTVAELPCEEKGCSGTPAGPFCDCGGTGMEGQYCSSRTYFYILLIQILMNTCIVIPVPDLFFLTPLISITPRFFNIKY